MTIQKNLQDTALTLALEGRLDTTTAPELEAAINEMDSAVTSLVLELSNLEYVSSAGLRVILKAQKTMNGKGTMVVRGAREEIIEVFEITGFSDILTIE